MQLRRIVIALEERQRVVLYPQGGLEIENLVVGVGWVLDTSGAEYQDLGKLLDETACLVAQQAQAHADHEDDLLAAECPW